MKKNLICKWGRLMYYFFSGSIPGRNIFWKVKHCSMSVQKLHITKFSTWLSEFWSWRLTEVLMIQCLLSERSGVCRLGGDFCWTKTWHEMNVILNRVTTEQGILHTDWAWWFSSLKKKKPSNSTYIEDNRAKVEKNIILTDKRINLHICAKKYNPFKISFDSYLNVDKHKHVDRSVVPLLAVQGEADPQGRSSVASCSAD